MKRRALQVGQPNGTVQVYSGSCYAERPRAFVWRGRPYCVDRVVRQWRTPAGMCFVVLAHEQDEKTGKCMEDQAGKMDPMSWWTLMYDEVRDQWHIRHTTER